MKHYIERLLALSHLKRFFFFFLFDILIITVSLYLSFLLRFDFALTNEYRNLVFKALPFFIIVKIITFGVFRMYKITWRYVGINDLCNIVNAVIVAASILMALFLLPLPAALSFMAFPLFSRFPRSIFLMDGIISLFFIAGIRISKRLFLEVMFKRRNQGKGEKTIIVGAGNTGEMILRDMARQEGAEFYPVALLDDNRNKIGAYMHGVKVFGATNELKGAIAKFAAEAVIIAIPSLDHKTLRTIYNAAKDSNVNTIKIVPRIYDFHKPDINLKNLEEIRIEDLIGRQAVEVNYNEMQEFLQDKVILVTGAGGSIGSEIVKQVCAFNPRKVILFDIDETALHNMQLKLRKDFLYLIERIHFITGDVRDEDRVSEVLEAFSPEIVFHAAAYKHVPMMEYNPKEAVKVNIFGTYLLAKASVGCGVKKFIMISTDKAVRPTSIMGATKRMAEYICKALNCANTEFISVRFGNVLGSRGSVLPLFLDQLKSGGPLTVTHKEMQRYFMTIPEAVSLVLQASALGKSGEVLVLDMGEPVKIVELAEELIRIHGLEPYKDIDIEFVGLRPGEKLFEEILTAEEGTVASKHNKIFISKNSTRYSREDIEKILEEFGALLRKSPMEDSMGMRDLLKRYITHYSDEARAKGQF